MTSLNFATASSTLPSLLSVTPSENAVLTAAISASAFLRSASDTVPAPPPPPGRKVKFSSFSSMLTRVSCVCDRLSLVAVTTYGPGATNIV
jgi:hypothetical protein